MLSLQFILRTTAIPAPSSNGRAITAAQDNSRAPIPHRGGLGARELCAPQLAKRGQREQETVGQWTVRALAEIFSGDSARARSSAMRAFAQHMVVDCQDRPVGPEELRANYGALFIHREVPDELIGPIRLEVIDQSNDWLAINKPAGLATIPRGSFVARSVTVAARRQFHNDEIVPIHRLDRLTSGVMLLSRRKETRGVFQQLFAQRKVAKAYLAASVPPVRRDTPLPKEVGEGALITLRLERGDNALGVEVCEGPANTQTAVHLAGISRGIWYWRLTPHTGRMHQLRATMAHFGAPLLGDPLYPRPLPASHAGWRSTLFLHSYRLTLTDPITSIPVDVRQEIDWWPPHFER